MLIIRAPNLSRPHGFTLMEVAVTLVILGLMAGLGALTWRPPAADGADGELDRVVSTARATALRRAQALELRLSAQGDWTLGPESVEASALAAGHVEGTVAPFVVRIDALGACTPRSAVSWDANRCQPVLAR